MNEMNTNISNLKISNIKIYKMDIPRKSNFQIATMRLEITENVLVQIRTNEGLIGWGEASPFHAIVGETQAIDLAAAKELKTLLIGKDPLAIAQRVNEMDRYLPFNNTIKSAFDMALYDIAARAAGMPLYRFLGGQKRKIETDLTIGIGKVEEAGAKALAILDEGFRIIKIKVGIDDQDDFQRIENIRRAVGEQPGLRIDANQGWDRMTAVRNLKRFHDFDIEFCEQPVPVTDLSGLKYVSQHSPIPVMADESLFSPVDALTLIREDAVPYFNIKLSKAGGLLRAMQIAHSAAAGSRPCMMGSMSETRLGLSASAHLAMAFPVFRFFDLDSFFGQAEDPVIGGVTVKNGWIVIPDEPGLGAEPDPDYLKKWEEIS